MFVTSQSSATRKRLLAISKRAFVRSLAGMYATMSGQRARIAERLLNYQCNPRNLFGTAHFATTLTHVWFLARVNSHMHCQGRALYEWFIAPFLWADMRPVAAVYPFYITVSVKILMVIFRCLYHDEQDHSFVQILYHNYCTQSLLHFHCCFVVNYQNHHGHLRAGCFVAAAVAAAACTHSGMGDRDSLLTALASVAAAGAQGYSSHPAQCGAGTAVRPRRQLQQGPFHSKCL